MSIFTRIVSGVAFCTLTLGTASFAQSTPAPLGLNVVQTTRMVLSDSDIRRINHYSAQTLEALLAFGGDSGSIESMDSLRQKVQRLTDAGQRSGLNIIATADYFAAYTADTTTTPLPSAFLNAAGRFDAATLLSSVDLYYQNAAPQVHDFTASDEADMAAISSVAQQRTPLAPVSQSLMFSVVELPIIEPVTPAIAANAPAEVRAILERVQLKGDNWVITVEQGDSLGRYANALYGDTRLFQQIFEANISTLITPNSIKVGQELVLPKS
ncbi:MAG: hypothetical protein GQ535_08340 [Rhodobacteraceae bacterium]|nr:hypothetical protein [Paracoccaceae bacterium]